MLQCTSLASLPLPPTEGAPVQRLLKVFESTAVGQSVRSGGIQSAQGKGI